MNIHIFFSHIYIYVCVCIIVIIYRDIGSQSFWEIGAPEVQYLFLMKGRAGEFGSGDLVTTELYTELGFRQVSTKRTGNSSASMRKSTVIGRNRVATAVDGWGWLDTA